MKKQLLSLGTTLLVLTLDLMSAVQAVQPVTIQSNSRVPWSQVSANSFDGAVVYDKHYMNDFVFITSWSKQGIRATYTRIDSKIVGYQSEPSYQSFETQKLEIEGIGKYRWKKTRVPIPSIQIVPIREESRTQFVPQKILFAINGRTYSYESGAVSDELAAALASAPAENMQIRLVWSPEAEAKVGVNELEIGKGTVAAWKTIFQSKR